MRIIAIFLFCSLLTFHCSVKAQQYGWVDLSTNLPDVPIKANMEDIMFVGDSGWIAGFYYIYFTSDGGNTWTVQNYQGADTLEFVYTIYMKDNLNGYAGTSDRIISTTNGGQTWNTLWNVDGPFGCITCTPQKDTCYSVNFDNSKIYKFTDNYLEDISYQTGESLYSIIFPESNEEGKLCGSSTIRRYLNYTWINLQIYDNSLLSCQLILLIMKMAG